MKPLKCILLTALVLTLSNMLISCSKDDEPDDSWKDSELCHKLVGTSWQLYSIVDYWNDGSEARRSDRLRPEIYTLTGQNSDETNLVNCRRPYISQMYDTNTNETKTSNWWLMENNTWLHTGHSPCMQGKVVYISSNELQLRFDYDDPEGCGCDYSIEYYKAVEQPGHSENWGDDDDDSGNSSNGNGGSNNGGNGGGTTNHHYPCKSCDESGDCWNCFGSGTDPITNRKCTLCHGSGKCQICHGKGYIIV